MVLNPETLSLEYFARGGDTELFQKGHIFCVRPDEKGNLWIGTSQGLFCYNRQAKADQTLYQRQFPIAGR